MSRFTDTVNRIVRYRVKRDFSQPRVGYTSGGDSYRLSVRWLNTDKRTSIGEWRGCCHRRVRLWSMCHAKSGSARRRWSVGGRMPWPMGSGAGSPRWTAAARLQAVIVTAAMDEATRSAWCREQGLYLGGPASHTSISVGFSRLAANLTAPVCSAAPVALHRVRWRARLGPTRARRSSVSDGANRRGRAAATGVHFGELCTKQKDLCRIVNPQQHLTGDQ